MPPSCRSVTERLAHSRKGLCSTGWVRSAASHRCSTRHEHCLSSANSTSRLLEPAAGSQELRRRRSLGRSELGLEIGRGEWTAIERGRRRHHLLTATQACSMMGGPDATSSARGTRRHAALAPRWTKPPKNGLREASRLVFEVQGGNDSGFRLQGGNVNSPECLGR